MTIKELLEELLINVSNYDENNTKELHYEIVIEEYNEVYEKYNLVETRLRTTNHETKQIILET